MPPLKENIESVVDASEKVAKTATKYPYGMMVVIAIAAAGLMYVNMQSNVARCEERFDKEAESKDQLYRQLLIKNRIIDDMKDTIKVQRDVMEETDSITREATENIIYNLKRKIK